MPYRAIQSSISTSESLAALTDFEARLWFYMLAQTDCCGRLPGTSAKVRALCMPLVAVDDNDVAAGLEGLVRAGRIRLYCVQGAWVCELVDFDKHQPQGLVGKARRSRFPDAPKKQQISVTHGQETKTKTKKRRDQTIAAATPAANSVDLDVSQVRMSPGRSRDELFDAVTAVCGIEPAVLTRRGRGALIGALRELREVGASPDEVVRRAASYRQQFAVALTPSALAKHWASLGSDQAPLANTQRQPSRYGRAMTTRQMLDVAERLR